MNIGGPEVLIVVAVVVVAVIATAVQLYQFSCNRLTGDVDGAQVNLPRVAH